MDDISKKTGRYSSASGGRITDEMNVSEEKRNRIKDEIKNVADFEKEIADASNKDTSELLEIIMGAAIYLGASDIHMEPEEIDIKVRLRIDGLLQDASRIDPKVYQSLLSRIKLLSGVKLNVTDRPQDGRFSVLLGDKKEEAIEIRVSVLPSEHGESTVMRVLNPKSLIGLEDLGLRPDLFSLFDKEIKKPNGMIIITGPTGSGKTTTLYAFLNRIQNPEIKIITIEDPIEYHLSGISQTQVNPTKGYDFASGLQAIVRQDPDVILVGEIRDQKTCQIAIQAALTGHLVFTTLHTNDAAGTVSRLISLGADLTNIGPAVNLAVAQRLARKVCKECKEMETVSKDELAKLKEGLKNIKDSVKLPIIDEKTKIARGKGCKACNFTGYRGRVGIFEAILIDDEMEKSVIKNPSIAAFREEAIRRGMVTMYQDGLIKVLNGETTIEEVERTTGE